MAALPWSMPERELKKLKESIAKNNEMLKRLHERIDDLDAHLHPQKVEPNDKFGKVETPGSGNCGPERPPKGN